MNSIVGLIKKFTKTQTIKDAFLVSLGMGLSTILSALSIFLIARFLGPSGFGIYTTALGIAIIITDAIDLAISSSIINFASGSKQSSKEYIKHGFQLKLILGLTAGLLFAVLSKLVSPLIHLNLSQPLLISSLFIPVVFLYRFPRSILQSEKRFLPDSSIEIVASLLRLVFILIFYYFLSLTVIKALTAYLLGAAGAFLFGSLFISWKFLKVKVKLETKKSFSSFQKWLTLGFILAAVHGRIDTVILLRLAGPEVTGIYQAAFRFFLPVLSLTAILSLIFAPRFASFPNQAIAKKYLKKTLLLSLAISSLVLLIIPLAPFLIRLIFGQGYLPAIVPTQILAVGFFAFMIGAPL